MLKRVGLLGKFDYRLGGWLEKVGGYSPQFRRSCITGPAHGKIFGRVKLLQNRDEAHSYLFHPQYSSSPIVLQFVV